MNYDEFKDYIITHLWKMGDTLVIENLDKLVTTAEHELNRVFKVEDRNRMADAQAISRRVQLPSDFRSMIALSNPRRGAMTYVTQQDYANKLTSNAGGNERYYTIANGELRVLGNPSPTSPLNLTMAYYANIPNFQQTNESWLAETYLDVYLYCVLKHTAPFLREDERLQTWFAMFDNALHTAMEENAHDVKFAGSPMKMKIGGVA